MNNEINEQTNSLEEDFYEEPKKKSKLAKILLILGILLIVSGVGSYVFINYVLMSDKNIITNSVKTVFTSAKTTLEYSNKNILKYDLEKEALGVQGTFTFKSDYKDEDLDLSKLSDYKITYGGVIDKANNKAAINVGLNDKTSELLNINSVINGKVALISLGDIYNKVLSTELDTEIKDLDMTESLNVDSAYTLINETELITEKFINSKNITKEKVDKTINGVKGTYTKTTYDIRVVDYIKYILEKYKENDEIIKILSDLSDESDKELKGDINKLLSDLKESENEDQLIIDVYMQGLIPSAKQVDVSYKSKIYDDEEDITKIELNIDKDVYTYKLLMNDEEYLNGKYDLKDSLFTVEREEDDEKLLLSLQTDKDTVTATVDYKSGEETMNLSLTSKNTLKDNTQNNIMTLDAKIESGEDKIAFTMENNMDFNKNSKIEEIDDSNVVLVDNITEEEYDDIMTKVLEKISPILEIMTSEKVGEYTGEAM